MAAVPADGLENLGRICSFCESHAVCTLPEFGAVMRLFMRRSFHRSKTAETISAGTFHQRATRAVFLCANDLMLMARDHANSCNSFTMYHGAFDGRTTIGSAFSKASVGKQSSAISQQQQDSVTITACFRKHPAPRRRKWIVAHHSWLIALLCLEQLSCTILHCMTEIVQRLNSASIIAHQPG